jgi:glycosyltransferase involved in cell wall biosynthesis
MILAVPPSALAARRIAFVCDWCLPRFGGLELQLVDLARALIAAGHAVEIITSTPGPSDVGGVPVRRLAGFRAPLFGFACSPRQFRELSELLVPLSYDVVHVHSGVVAPLAYGATRIAVRAGLPTAVTFHSVYAYLRPALGALASMSGAGRWPVAWTAVSRRVAGEAKQALTHAGQSPEVAVLPNGLDPTEWCLAPGAAREESNEFRLVSVLRLQVRKRPRSLFRVLDAAQRQGGAQARFTLDIIGDGPERATVERLAAARNGSVRVHGRLDRTQIRDVFALADAFVLPTRMESFGIAALEARCAGLPVIARRGTGTEDFITHREHGLLADSDVGLADAVVELARDVSLRQSIAARNRATTPPYAWPDVVAATLAQYDRAVRQRQAQ